MKLPRQLRLLMAFLLTFVKNTSAQVGGGAQSIIGILVGILVSVFIGIVVIVSLIGSVTPDTTWTASANTTWATLQANTWVALSLVVIIPIIVGAVAIMSVIRRGGMG